tara:strand:+ start:35099 stop:35860 length:762 start_codon:yes stop_codon:yes gene_type:complete
MIFKWRNSLRIILWIGMLYSTEEAEINRIIDKTDNEYQRVRDFEAKMIISLNVPGFRLPKKEYKVYYKSPNKVKVNTKGFGVLPKTGLFTSPKENFNNLKNIQLYKNLDLPLKNSILLSGTVIADSLKAQFPNEYAKLTFSPTVDVVVDTNRWLIQSVTTRIDTIKLFQIKNSFDLINGEFYMPIQSQVEYYIKDARLASWLNNDLSGIMKIGGDIKKSNDVVEGVINVKYNNYKINLDLPDRLFKKAPEKRD